jgi:histidinol-phosphate aminotransferase
MEEIKVPLYANLAYDDDVIRLAQNENPYGASPKVLEAIKKNIDSISLYPDFVLTKLKNNIAEINQVLPDEIAVSAGSCALIDQIVFNFVKPGENIVFPELTFIAYKLCAEIHNREYRLAEMDNYYISLENILKLCDNKTKVVFLANPNNPTGTIFTHTEIIDFLNKIPKGTYVVLDEAYNEYVEDKDFPDSRSILKLYENVIIFRSFSKIYGLAGLRVGYAIAEKSLIKEIEKNRIPFTVTTISNYAALEALKDKEFVKECVMKNQQERELLVNGLISLGYNVVPSHSNFVFIYFSSTVERDKMYNTLFENKIIVRKLEAFGDNHSLRISIGKPEENFKIMECLAKY